MDGFYLYLGRRFLQFLLVVVLGITLAFLITHLSPVAAAFHPMLLTFADADRLRGLPIHIIHGAHDWMFPPHLARDAERTLAQAGAQVVYREIADLSHTYPRDENGRILDWFGITSS